MMDVCLGLGVGETMLTLMQSRKNSRNTSQHQKVEKLRDSSFFWSSVSSRALLQRSRIDTNETSGSGLLNDSRSVCSGSDSNSDDSCSSTSRSSSTSSSSSSYSKMSLWGSRKREGRKPVLVEKTPFGRKTEYLTVHVGTRVELSVKYVISRKLLTHPLFQVLLKCSEDEFGEDYTVNKGVAIACDPALFIEVVKAVDEDLWPAQNVVDAIHDSESS